MEGISKYILSITAVCICCGVIRRLTGEKGGASAVVHSLCGIVLAITVISPVVKIRAADLGAFTDDIQVDAGLLVQQGIDLSTQELRTIITEKTTAYILEKASSYDCSIDQLEVELSSDSVPVPSGVRITGTFSPQVRNQLSGAIDANLGIPKEKQQWIYQN